MARKAYSGGCNAPVCWRVRATAQDRTVSLESCCAPERYFRNPFFGVAFASQGSNEPEQASGHLDIEMNRLLMSGVAAATLAAAGLPAASLAANPTSAAQVQTPASLHAADLAFGLHAADGGNAEVALFQHCAASCIDPDLKRFAGQHVPATQQHKEMAQELLVEAKRQANAG